MAQLSLAEHRILAFAIVAFVILLCGAPVLAVLDIAVVISMWPLPLLLAILAAGMWLPLQLIVGALADGVLPPDQKEEWSRKLWRQPLAFISLWWRYLR